jgi:uncharacterized protein YdeI (YjbR/CyaY-like superfamily)
MGKKNPAVDAYIAKSPEFARPVLTYLRAIVHEGCPDVVEELKWGAPFYMYKGVLCHTGAFKEHCALGFWKGSLVVGKNDIDVVEKAAGQFGRITKVSDLPPRERLIAYVKKAASLNDAGVPSPRSMKAVATKKAAIRTPPVLAAALARSKRAKATYDAFSPSHRREYIEWIMSAKTDATRDRRIEQALGWMAEGKSRNWKYVKPAATPRPSRRRSRK